MQGISAGCSLFCLNNGIAISWAEWLRIGRIEIITDLLFRQVHIIDIIQIGFIIFQQVTFRCSQRCKRPAHTIRTLIFYRSDNAFIP